VETTKSINKASFRQLSFDQRMEFLQEQFDLTDEEVDNLSGRNSMPIQVAENLIENAIGYFSIPLGVATHFRIDGRDMLIPMAVEETSIIAAASATAKWVKNSGHIVTGLIGNLIIGQIQIPHVENPSRGRAILEANRQGLIDLANAFLPGLAQRGGGVRDIVVRELERPDGVGKMLVLHVLCDPCDAMGANLINQVCEALKPKVEELTGEAVGLCILSNLVDGKLAVAEVVIEDIDSAAGYGIQEAALFAKADPYRAATHNKGVLNGIDPIVIATGNDWRAVEAGVHAYAARSGKYQPITDWKMNGKNLVGRIEVPLALGTVGGVTRLHPTARTALKILGVEHAGELARICAAVGLVQNLGALKALSTVGIVKGHMSLHAANLALAAGCKLEEIPIVRNRLAEILKTEKHIGVTRAREVLEEIRRSAVNKRMKIDRVQ